MPRCRRDAAAHGHGRLWSEREEEEAGDEGIKVGGGKEEQKVRYHLRVHCSGPA